VSESRRRRPRAIVLALGGATPDLLERAPSLAVLRERGTWRPIRSTIPPSAACAWTSFATAQDPGQHGVFDSEQFRPGTYRLVATSGSTRRVRTIWEYLNDRGLSVGLYQLPWTCPVPVRDGWTICGDEAPPPKAMLVAQPVDVGVFYVDALAPDLSVREEADRTIAELLTDLPEATAIIGVSAYGLAPARIRVNLGRALAEAGLLCYDRRSLFAWGDYAQVRLNLQGREPEGIVRPEEREAVVAEVKRVLLGIEDPETGERLFRGALSRDELYHGPHTEAAADVVGLPAEGVDAPGRLAAAEAPMVSAVTGAAPVHTLSGLFFAVGPVFRRGRVALRGEASILDVGPTLLHALGVNLPQDIDGRVITRAFDPAYLAEHPPKYSEACLGPRETVEEAYTEEEADEVEKRLRDLGYM
jgi:predicted AlkP superfamily phosphohydrolase/phosphomutase